jgi:hypothetical protein
MYSLYFDIFTVYMITINANASKCIFFLPQITIPSPYFSFGKKYTNIIHTKLRHNCILLCDLHKRNITNSPYCSCGHIEDTYHFFFACKKYSRARNNMFNRLFSLDLVNIDTLLLSGDNALPIQTNINIFTAVHKFIDETCRFTN